MSYWMETTTDQRRAQRARPQNLPVQVIGSLVQEGVILSDKLSPDQLGTWLLHHHFFGQLEISGEEPAELRATAIAQPSNTSELQPGFQTRQPT